MVVSLNIRVENLQTVNRNLRRIDKRFSTMSILNFGRAVAKRAKFELRKNYVPDRSGQRTGDLERSIRAISFERGKEVSIEAGATHGGYPYGGVVEAGRDPVFAKPGRRLRFIGREGYPVYVKRVKGAAGKHFMENAAAWARSEIGRYMRTRIQRILQSKGVVDDYNVESSIAI